MRIQTEVLQKTSSNVNVKFWDTLSNTSAVSKNKGQHLTENMKHVNHRGTEVAIHYFQLNKLLFFLLCHINISCFYLRVQKHTWKNVFRVWE